MHWFVAAITRAATATTSAAMTQPFVRWTAGAGDGGGIAVALGDGEGAGDASVAGSGDAIGAKVATGAGLGAVWESAASGDCATMVAASNKLVSVRFMSAWCVRRLKRL